MRTADRKAGKRERIAQLLERLRDKPVTECVFTQDRRALRFMEQLQAKPWADLRIAIRLQSEWGIK
jgi:hypothetical protein